MLYQSGYKIGDVIMVASLPRNGSVMVKRVGDDDGEVFTRSNFAGICALRFHKGSFVHYVEYPEDRLPQFSDKVEVVAVAEVKWKFAQIIPASNETKQIAKKSPF